MIHPPPNPNDAAARAAIVAYNEGSAQAEYNLTWPADQHGVCCVSGQWRRNEAGEIEAWYSAAQLRDVLAAIQAAQKWA